nr:hypothetical protein [Tanacetum cinerariifolium]
TSNALHNAIMEAGSKDRPLMLALDKEVLTIEGSSITTTESYMENYKNVLQDIRDQLNAEAEAVQIILTGIDNDIYSTIDACPNACEMWKAIERNRGKTIVNSPPPIYDQEPSMVVKDDEMSKDKDIDKLMALISLSFKKIYKPTNTNLQTSSNTSRANQDNSPRINRGTGYDNQRIGNVAGTRENVEQADWKDDTDDESDDQELEAHYMYMAKLQEVTPDAADNSGPIFDTKPVQQVQTNDNYNVFVIESVHPEQSKYVNDTYPIKKDKHNVIIDSLDMNYAREQIDQDDDYDLDNVRELLASLIEKLKCEIDDIKNRNKFLETSNKALVNKLKETNKMMYNDIKKFQAELDRRNDVKYVSKVEIDCAKAKGDLILYKMESQKSFNAYTQQINDLNQMISEMKKELFAHQDTIFILTQQKEGQIKLYKTRKDKELEKVIGLENKVKVLDNIVYKTGQSVQTMNMLNRNCKTSFAKPEFLKKAQRVNPRLLNAKTSNVNFVCATCGKCVLNEKHDMCVLKSHNSVNFRSKMHMAVPVSSREPKRIVNQSVAKPLRRTVALESTNQKPKHTTRKLYEHVTKTCSWWYPKFTPPGYKWKPKSQIGNVNPNLVEIILFIVDSGCSKHMTRNLKLLTNFMEKYLGSVKFSNDQITPILGYGDLLVEIILFIVDPGCSKHMTGNLKLLTNFVEKFLGLNHNFFSVGQFYDADLEVAFRKSMCYIRDLKGNDLLTGSRGTDLYSISLQDTFSPNPICLMAKATSSQSWLWHHYLSYLNFDTINLLSKNDIVIGLSKLKFVKDHLCSSYELGKAKRKSFPTKTTPSSKRWLQLLHMDLCGPIQGIVYQTSVVRTPEQNGIVERRNRTLVEAARIMLSAAKVPLFFWAEEIATSCFTQNHSLVIPRHEKTPYHIINNQKPSV